MIRKKLITLLLCLSFPAAAAPPLPEIESESYILMDADTGVVLAEKNPDLRLPPASLTKIMTAYAGFKAISEGRAELQQQVRVSRNAWAQSVAGSKMFLEVDTDVRIEELLRGIIIQSGNDASIALAESLVGDEAAFAQWMNEQAEKLELKNSHFVNATGLPDEQHYSSARDMALLVRRTVLDFPDFYKMYAEPEYTYNNIRQENRNGLLDSFAGADGVKTGYTKAAGYCLAASAVRNGQRLISVVMKTASIRKREIASSKLLAYGFNHFKQERPFDDKKTRKLPVAEGVEKMVTAKPTVPVLMTIERGQKVKALFHPVTPLIAPINKDMVVGFIEISVDNAVVGTVTVAAVTDVAAVGRFKR
jgi:D-alanyl-D-alanine carboxypeptidase (penicillin-binding protein 5/6)